MMDENRFKEEMKKSMRFDQQMYAQVTTYARKNVFHVHKFFMSEDDIFDFMTE
jgi:hypothetical protein